MKRHPVPLHPVTYAPAKFEVATSKGLGEEIHIYFTFDLGITQKQCPVGQYPLHHVNYIDLQSVKLLCPITMM